MNPQNPTLKQDSIQIKDIAWLARIIEGEGKSVKFVKQKEIRRESDDK